MAKMNDSEAKYQFKKIGSTANRLLKNVESFKVHHKEKQTIEVEAVNALLRHIEYELALTKESVERPFTSD